jgi:hypothetical protein
MKYTLHHGVQYAVSTRSIALLAIGLAVAGCVVYLWQLENLIYGSL